MALWISCSDIATGHIPLCLQSIDRYLISLIKRGGVQSVLLRFIPQCCALREFVHTAMGWRCG